MTNELKYNGHSANPSDYECNDGDLATSIGIVPEDGTMKPILPPSEIMELGAGYVVKFIHETSNFKHYILLNTSGTLSWKNKEDIEPTILHNFYKGNTVYQVTGVGNTLVVLTKEGMHYFLWKGVTDGYLDLGTHIPECPLSFGLQGEVKRTDEFEISFDPLSFGDLFREFTDSNKKRITEQVLAKVNKFIADNSTNKGKFLYPFLLRYAYRLYDGSLTMHSAPILMIASSDLAPQAICTDIDSKFGIDYTKATLRVVGVFHTLDYAVVSKDTILNLLDWSDIVSSIDVFISKPIYTYDQNGECKSFSLITKENINYYCVCKQANLPLSYRYRTLSEMYDDTYKPEKIGNRRLMLPKRSVDDVKRDIKECSQFYFLESIKVDHLTTSRTALPVEEDYLQSLVTREVMTDDYDSHDSIIPQYSFSYNSRLNITNLKKQLFQGHSVSCMLNYSNDCDMNMVDVIEEVIVYVFIRQDGRDIVVRSDLGIIGCGSPILFLYYPNTNAYKAILQVRLSDGKDSFYEAPLEKHNFLNGSFYFDGWRGDLKNTTNTVPITTSLAGRTIDIVNKIYTSEVNNPFMFPLRGINTIGTGHVYGISSAAKALSEGQFGQFPLYAFTSDGVWALEVSTTGFYSAKQPITRDVCINADSITQIDSAVLFATNRGIMLISGSETQCITDVINDWKLFSITDLPKNDALVSIFNSKAHDYEKLTLEDITMIPFLDFISACRMVYDYTHQRIIVYNPTVRYAYVYSLKSHSWGMMLSDVYDNVNSYPEALAMSKKKKTIVNDDGHESTTTVPVLVDFTQSSVDSTTGLIITRPFKMNAPDMFKTIDTIIQRGFFKSENVQQVLYGSNDLYNWHTVWSSKDRYMRGFSGTPYKSFRLAIIFRLDKAENIYGCSIQYNPRRLNQPR